MATKFHYPMLTEMEVGRKFVIDAAPILNEEYDLMVEHGFDIEGEVREFLLNTTADINDLEELDEFVLDLADVLYDTGVLVSFIDKGYIFSDIHASK